MIKLICTNKNARRNYELLESFEAGIVLLGSEVKSLREAHANLNDAYVRVENGEAYLHQAYIGEYKNSNQFNHEPKRTRKLLLKKQEIRKIYNKVNKKGFNLIPVKLYFKGARAKIEICIAKGKKTHDKRQDIKKRDQQRDMARTLRKYQ